MGLLQNIDCIDKKATLDEVKQFQKSLVLVYSRARGELVPTKQPLSVFYSRQIVEELEQAISTVSKGDELMADFLRFYFFDKHLNKATNHYFMQRYQLTERHFYKMKQKALLAFATWFDGGKLLSFKEGQDD